MKTVLLIDDLRVFKAHPGEDTELHIARTSKEALALLSQQPDKQWDEIWFDHDLGMVKGKPDTSLPVVDYLSEQAFFNKRLDIGTVFIHTSNSVGAKAITVSLERFGYHTVRVQAEHVFDTDKDLYWKAVSASS